MEEELAAMDEQLADYSPNERPSSIHMSNSGFRSGNGSEIQSDSSPDDGSDADDSDGGGKKLRMKDMKCSDAKMSSKQEKYAIWSRELQESALTDELNICCGVEGNFERTRDCESYDFSKAYKLAAEHYQQLSPDGISNCEGAEENVEETNRAGSSRNLKRRHNSMGDGYRRGYRGRHNQNNRGPKGDTGVPKILSPLSVSVTDNDADIARDIASKLFEEKEDLIAKVVNVLGKEKAIELYEETKKIEEEGGMTILKGTRRRTSGGIYLFILKNDKNISEEDKESIFSDDRRKATREIKEAKVQRRRMATEELRRTLVATDGLTYLPQRAELVTKKGPMEDADQDDVPEEGDVVTNPPPSPAWDGRENGGIPPAQERELNSYDDVLDLGGGEDVMDVF
ncbi:phosphorylated adapter RNA export protein [Ischnura elegans]|uniref:phosphorylated adapter RNA export protein n=1 Tax=Ischnura elegans TaxID=197161 RepID=UPI001ED897A8|nr:phosphorylated adapter RNA export protein [Ischnura elegans]